MRALTDRNAAVTEEHRDNCRGRSRIDAVAEQKVTVISGGAKTASKKVATWSAINSQIVILHSSRAFNI